ncbi:MAG: hypothetical protein KFF46_04580 [Desulfobacterales bacterium]|nr:hypothetical protein [Desulfobacterales bacterium]
MNNVKPFNNQSGKNDDKADACYLKSEVAYRSKLQEISNAVYAAADIDGIQRELVSRFKSGTEINEIRPDELQLR